MLVLRFIRCPLPARIIMSPQTQYFVRDRPQYENHNLNLDRISLATPRSAGMTSALAEKAVGGLFASARPSVRPTASDRHRIFPLTSGGGREKANADFRPPENLLRPLKFAPYLPIYFTQVPRPSCSQSIKQNSGLEMITSSLIDWHSLCEAEEENKDENKQFIPEHSLRWK